MSREQDQEIELMQFVLQYLLKNEFASKADMARQLGINDRTVQRLFEQLATGKAKGSSIVLNRALLFCVERKLSMDLLLESFAASKTEADETPAMKQESIDKDPAYQHLYLPKPDTLTEQGETVYQYAVDFLQKSSLYLCPRCVHWCNPWHNQHWQRQKCLLAHMADVMLQEIRGIYIEGKSSFDPG